VLVAEANGVEVVKLADFGLARVYQASQLSGLTLTGDVGGTPAFMPPEQITAYREAKPPADQYAAAATLYNLLTGEYAYDLPARGPLRYARILNEPPVPILSRRSDLPPGLAAVIHRAMQRDPARRFLGVAEFRKALDPFRSA
jgi:serine/threonine-protein kinase